jgi:hypothetical protein
MTTGTWNYPKYGTYPPGAGYGYHYPPPPAVDPHQALAPLLTQLAAYDRLRLQLEQEGGKIADLEQVTQVLREKIPVRGAYTDYRVALAGPHSLKQALHSVGHGDLHLQVRLLPTRMPVFYLCKSHRDYWGEYSLIVEDLYQSPGYPLVDDRFVKLLLYGRETYCLRLSPYREEAGALVTPAARATSRQVDNLLHQVGRHVFQAAWHEDQRLGIVVANHFGLSRFRQAIELLYLCLSGDLCALRLAVGDQMLQFFQDVYTQPAIQAFLAKLTLLEGQELNDVPQQALKLYPRLSRAFSRFLGQEVEWGQEKMIIPLYKLIYGNFYRLDLVAQTLQDNHVVREGKTALEDAAGEVVGAMVATRN